MIEGRRLDTDKIKDITVDIKDYSGIDFDVRQIEELIHLCYPDRYKKKLSTLRTQQTKLSNKKLEWEKENNNE